MSFFKELGDGLTLGFLRKPLKKATGLSDMQLLGLTGAAVAAPFAAPALAGAGATGAGAAAGATGAATAGGASGAATGAASAGGLMSYAKPAMTMLQGASMAQGLMGGGQQQPIQHAQLNTQSPNFGGLLTAPQGDAAAQKRLQQQQMALRGLLGVNYG